MPYDFNIYHSQVTPSIPDYDTINVVLTSDLVTYATQPYVASEINRNNAILNTTFYPLSGNTPITGNLNVTGNLSAANINVATIFGQNVVAANTVAADTMLVSGAPVVVSTQTFETPTTGISAIQNVIALSQVTYDALTIKRPNTLYIIV